VIFWSAAAQADLGRIYRFIAQYDFEAAALIFDELIDAPEALVEFPRRGPRLTEFEPREIRELRVRKYVLRYELTGSDIRMLRCFHEREDRG
jgi:plasmid stabilization system protein ParE